MSSDDMIKGKTVLRSGGHRDGGNSGRYLPGNRCSDVPACRKPGAREIL